MEGGGPVATLNIVVALSPVTSTGERIAPGLRGGAGAGALTLPEADVGAGGAGLPLAQPQDAAQRPLMKTRLHK